MDIKELQDYRLSDAIKFHNRLNPKIWGRDEHLLPEVREKLMAIAQDFKEFLGLDLEVVDITLSGSNAAYTYSDHSDVDLHLVADLPKADASDVYRELFDAKKYQYNDQHNYKIGGYDVELYVQNANEPPNSQGIYSVLNNEWIKVPARRKATVNDESVRSKYEDIGQRIDAAIKSGDSARLEAISNKVREMRQAGLDTTGEFGPENLAFKVLRSNGTLDRLRQARLAARDRELSVDETVKQPVKYGYRNEDWHPNAEPPGAESKPEMPAGTVLVDVSDTYDWYKLGQDISDLEHANPKMYGQGAPQTILSFGSEDLEHQYIKKLERLGLKTHDIDPKGKIKDRETDYKVNESADVATQLDRFVKFCSGRLGIKTVPRIQLKRDPAWSERNKTFGRYIPDTNTLILSIANRHPVDVMRTLAHELVHRQQEETEPMPLGAGDTGSDWENEANAQAGVIMRGFAEKNPQVFRDTAISEASGYIPVNKKEAKDPRYSMALTVDIKPGENQRQAAKMGWKTDPAGTPPTARTNGLIEALTAKLQAVKEDKDQVPPTKWQDIWQLNGQISTDQWCQLIENYHLGKSVLKESVDESIVKKIDSLIDNFSSDTIVGQRYIPVFVVGINNRISYYDAMGNSPAVKPAEFLTLVQIKNGQLTFEDKNKKQFTYPDRRLSGISYSAVIALDSIEKYNKLRSWLKLKDGVDLPAPATKSINEQEQEIEEVAMSPSALRAFAASPAAQGMMAGFEAELIFSGIGDEGEAEPEWEPDYEMDERAYDIEGIIDFFQSGDFAELGPRAADRIRNQMYTDYQEWLDEKMRDDWENDKDVAIREYLEVREYLEGEELKQRVEAALEEENDDYDNAREVFEEDWQNTHENDESDWLRSIGIRYMTDANNTYDDLMWPHYTDVNQGSGGDGEFSEASAQRLADDLTDTLDVETTVSSGYHSATRDAKSWIFEPDGSLSGDEPGDMPVEIVSPPMPLAQALEIMPKFFAWAESNGAYANKSTGFHMSVSMPEHEGNFLDYTKLALFLGDEYVLKQFGREANTYAKSAISKIRDTMSTQLKESETRAENVLSAMRKHLGHFASRALAQPSGFGKYTSINPKNNYIEFRSAGGSDYFRDIDKIQNTLMRYARAVDIAMDPDAEKSEYARKLYKLLTKTETEQVTDPRTGTTRTQVKPSGDNDAINIFSRYVAGELPKSALKSFLKQIQYSREVSKNPPTEKIQWRVTHPNGKSSIIFQASSAEEAIQLAKQEWNDRMNPDDAYRAEPYIPATQTPQTDQGEITVGNIPVNNPRGEFVIRRREGTAGTGPVLFRFDADNNREAIEIARRWSTARGIERGTVWLDHVSGLEPEELAPRTVQATLGEPRPAFQEPPASWDGGPPAGNQFSGEWKVVDGLGREVHRFGGIGNSQADANRVARQWAQQTGFDGNLEVYPVMR